MKGDLAAKTPRTTGSEELVTSNDECAARDSNPEPSD